MLSGRFEDDSVRYGILSDIHGNHDALDAVLRGLEREGVDSYVCLGDIVGYGPEPTACVQRIRKVADCVVAGNHDLAVADKLSIEGFNVLAREATLWTRNELSDEDMSYLAQLPLVEYLDGLDVVHSTLCSPELFDYIQTSYDASLSMVSMRSPVCFVGHSHVPVVFVQNGIITYSLEPEITIGDGLRAIVNVGSVGQPRDRDPRACCAIYDTETRNMQLKRYRYDIEAVVNKVRAAGLPVELGARLRLGR